MDAATLAAIAAAAAANPIKIEVPDQVTGRVLHIDGDYAAYYFAGNDDTAPGIARTVMMDAFETMRVNSGAVSTVVHITLPQSHKGLRYIAATVKPYQGHRGGRKPKNWQFLRDYLEAYDGERVTVQRWADREADDAMAMWAYAACMAGHSAVIATRDKDMRMLPGHHMDWGSRKLVASVPLHAYSVIVENGLQYGYKWLLLQLLHGDTADNIPGLERVVISGKVKQCGEVTAAGLLAIVDELDAPDSEKLLVGWNIVEDAYESYYGEDTYCDRLAEQLALLYLRHDKSASVASWTKNSALYEVAAPKLVEAALTLEATCRYEWEKYNA